VGLALHTVVGAIWKFSHSAEQTMPSLKAIPASVWLGLSGLEIICALALVLAPFYKPLAFLVPTAAVVIALEMLLFCGLHLGSGALAAGTGATAFGPLVYWLVVAVLCLFLAYGRFRY
jgi:hypothetical protein